MATITGAEERRPIEELIEDGLAAAVSGRAASVTLIEACRWALFPRGKRIRPRLSLSICADLGGEIVPAAGAAIALELLHTASLIHDDLPALDNDDMRRGKASCHKKFGEATALLAADYLTALAFRVLADAELKPNLKISAASLVADAFCAVCNGQNLDCQKTTSLDELSRIHDLKTGALFRASAGLGAIFANQEGTTLEKCLEFGLEFGRAFQLLDDYIDIFGSDEERGRKGSSDSRNEKKTFFSLSLKKEGEAMLSHSLERAEKALSLLEESVFIRAGNSTRTIFKEIFKVR